MKKKYIKIISSCIFMLCMSIALVFTVFGADTSETKEIQYVLGLEYATDNTIPTIPEDFETDLSGYLFAGWYTQNGNTYTVVSNPTIGGTYYAKFVPEEVLGIKAQVSANIIDGETDVQDNNAIRLVTSLDSTHYEAIGFHITRGTKDYDADTTNKVYKTLYAVDATEATEETKLTEYVPSEQFHSQSVYFKTWTISKIPEIAFNTDITVTPYWITLDGTRVEGTTSIKTVNLGRSWVYINTKANNTDKKEYGTYDHPFTGLADALNAIVLNKNGKIIIQENATITMASDFAWSEHGKDLTITGEGEKTETLNFSNITNFRMGDSVTFENMTLKLPTGQLYCNGHRFEIAENVVSDNEGLIIFGGDNKSKVTGDTSVTLLSGSYEAVYGGGLGQDVDGDTHVIIRNANVNSKTTPDGQGLVCGGGRKGDVTGNAYVTVGANFNKDLDVFDSAHTGYSKVCGGGYGDGTDSTTNDPAVVEKNTYVYIEDGAKVIYAYGAGYKYSDVNGKSYVECNSGEVMSIYGGCAAYGDNASTSVVINSGTVDQIFGGNESGMTGNTDVRVLGGTVNRRVYGGCYNNSSDTGNYVTGTTSVAIGGNVKFDFGASSLVERISANSRYNSGEQEEVGILIFNDGSYNANYVLSLGSDSYDYLVQATEGGAVYSEGDSIRVKPDDGMVATVRVDSAEENVGSVHAYITSEGLCELPALDSSTGQRNVYVVFTEETPADVDLDKYEATANGTHYETLEEAISEAKILSAAGETPVVTLLKDVEIESVINVETSDNFIVQSKNENDTQYKITAPTSATDASQNVFTVSGKLTINNVDIIGGYRGIQVLAGGDVDSTDGVSISGTKEQGLHVTDAKVNMTGLTVAGTGTQAVLFQKGTNAEISKFTVNGDGSSAAVRIQTGANVTLIDGTINANETYGIYMDGDSSKVTATNVIVNRASGNQTTLVVVATASIFELNEETEGKSGILGDGTTTGRGVEVQGTFHMNGGTISGHNVTSGISGEFVLSKYENNGAGVYVADGGVFNMNGGTIQSNQASTGAGVALPSGAIFTMNDGKIISNTATTNAGGIVLRSGGSLTINEGAEISGNSAASTKNGGGIYVQGSSTFILGGCTIENNSAKNGRDIYLEGQITLSKALSSHISIKPKSYSEDKVIVTNGSDYSTSMQYLDVEENNGHWYVNEEGKLKAGPIVLQSTGMGYATLSDAISVASDGDTITVNKDATVTETISIATSLTITSDKAVTITASDTLEGNMFTVAEGGALTITGTASDKNITLDCNSKATSAVDNNGTTQLNNVIINDAFTYGIHVGKGTVTVKNTIIDNANISESSNKPEQMRGIYAEAGTLNLDNVKVQNFIGTKNNNHGIHLSGATMNVTNAEGDQSGLVISQVYGHGVAVTNNSIIKISKIAIDGQNKTRVGIFVNKANSDENKVAEATIDNCSVQIRLQNASTLTLPNGTKISTTSSYTDYNVDGTKK